MSALLLLLLLLLLRSTRLTCQPEGTVRPPPLQAPRSEGVIERDYGVSQPKHRQRLRRGEQRPLYAHLRKQELHEACLRQAEEVERQMPPRVGVH